MAFTIASNFRHSRRGGILSRIVTFTYTDSVSDNEYATDSFDTQIAGPNGERDIPLRTIVSVTRTDDVGTDLDSLVVYGANQDPDIDAGDALTAEVVEDQAALATGTLDVGQTATENGFTSYVLEGHARFLALYKTASAAHDLTIEFESIYG